MAVLPKGDVRQEIKDFIKNVDLAISEALTDHPNLNVDEQAIIFQLSGTNATEVNGIDRTTTQSAGDGERVSTQTVAAHESTEITNQTNIEQAHTTSSSTTTPAHEIRDEVTEEAFIQRTEVTEGGQDVSVEDIDYEKYSYEDGS